MNITITLFPPRIVRAPVVPFTSDKGHLLMAIAAEDQAQLDRLTAISGEIDTFVNAKVDAANQALATAQASLTTTQAALDAANAAATQAAADHAETVAAYQAQIDALNAKLTSAA